MDLGLQGAIALVVGGSYGIGGAVVRALAQEGAIVTVMARNEAALETSVAEVQKATGGNVFGIRGDATVRDDIECAVNGSMRGGRLDLAILAAGGSKRGRLADLADEDWLRSYDLNLLSAVRLARATAPLLRRSRGSLTFLGAASGKQPALGQLASNASKGALINLTRALGEELAPEVRVNSVCPGRVLTPRRQRRAEIEAPEQGLTLDAYLERSAQTIPLKRIGTPEEIADVVVFLASPRASFITGQSISADGGLVRAII